MMMAHVTGTCLMSVAWLEDLMMFVMPAVRYCQSPTNELVANQSKLA
jgi:hypothetical protein